MESNIKKPKKHKHKRSKDKSSKKNKQRLTQCLPLLLDDGQLITKYEHSNDMILDKHRPCSEVMAMDVMDGEIIMSKGNPEHTKIRKSKKKDKNKDKGSNKKDRKSSKKDNKADGEARCEKKDGNAEKTASNKDEDGTDSEEERWLHAIEAGRLAEVDDELKRICNPRLLTARQRALLQKQRPSDAGHEPLPLLDGGKVGEGEAGLQDSPDLPIIPPEPLLALPTGFKQKALTQEMLEKRALKSQRRRAQALEKREEDKKKTVDRLLKKQDPTKMLRAGFIKKSARNEVAMMTYRSNRAGAVLLLPPGCEYPVSAQGPRPPPPVTLCSVPGCSNPKRYSCSRSGVPLCSLSCYTINAASLTASA